MTENRSDFHDFIDQDQVIEGFFCMMVINLKSIVLIKGILHSVLWKDHSGSSWTLDDNEVKLKQTCRFRSHYSNVVRSDDRFRVEMKEQISNILT